MATRKAFTLIELLAVLLIAGLLSAVAAVSLAGTVDRFQLRVAASAVKSFDARARRQARQSRLPVETVIETDRGRMRCVSPRQGTDWERQLSSRVEIGDIRVRRRRHTGSRCEITFDALGHCPSYALELRRGRSSRWIVVLGVSGQVIELQREGDVDEILSL